MRLFVYLVKMLRGMNNYIHVLILVLNNWC